jgi:hypothetical protein
VTPTAGDWRNIAISLMEVGRPRSKRCPPRVTSVIVCLRLLISSPMRKGDTVYTFAPCLLDEF